AVATMPRSPSAVAAGAAIPGAADRRRSRRTKHKSRASKCAYNRRPGESRDPPVSPPSLGKVGPGFPHGSSPWAEGPRDDGLKQAEMSRFSGMPYRKYAKPLAAHDIAGSDTLAPGNAGMTSAPT